MFIAWPGRQLLTSLGSELASAHETEVSATFTGLCLWPTKNLLSELSYIRESQTLGNLVPIPRVFRHLGISRGAVIQPPYLIVTIGRSSRRSPCRATHTVQKVPFFSSSRSRKLATLGKGHIVGVSFVLLVSPEYIWDCFLFLFILFILYV